MKCDFCGREFEPNEEEENDILMDMQVCKVEGWDKTEYIRQLQELLNGFKI